MKNAKFIILLFLIISFGLTSIIWLIKLQIFCNQVSECLSADAVPIETNLKIRSLTIVDKEGKDRMFFGTFGHSTAIDIYNADESKRLSYFDYGPGEKATFTLYSINGAKIELNTFAHSPLITIQDQAGRYREIGTYGMGITEPNN